MKKLIFVLAFGLVLSMATSALAVVQVTFTGTGDNWMWYWNGANWLHSPSPIYNYWENTETVTYNPAKYEPLTLYFAVMDETPSNWNTAYANPGGFLAQISTTGGWFKENGQSSLLTDPAYWEVAFVDRAIWDLETIPTNPEHGAAEDPSFNPTDERLNWVTPDPYGNNTGSYVNPGSPGWTWSKVNGIDQNALWLWTHYNSAQPPAFYNATDDRSNGGQDMLAVFRTTVTTIPEPSSMVLLGMGVLGLFGLGRRRKA